jgi:hypothetical protein
MQHRLSDRQRQVLRRLNGYTMEAVNDPERDELARMGLVEKKLGGWGLTQEGRRRAITG